MVGQVLEATVWVVCAAWVGGGRVVRGQTRDGKVKGSVVLSGLGASRLYNFLLIVLVVHVWFCV